MFKTLKLVGVVLFLVIAGSGLSYLVGRAPSSEKVVFENLTAGEMHDQIISERDFAIKKAEEDGKYRCCIEPPCTMCYMEANPWNNFTPGTCACDDLIAQGKEPCPQCKNGLCEGESESTYCDISGSGHPM